MLRYVVIREVAKRLCFSLTVARVYALHVQLKHGKSQYLFPVVCTGIKMQRNCPAPPSSAGHSVRS
jgi:hypothetical protein